MGDVGRTGFQFPHEGQNFFSSSETHAGQDDEAHFRSKRKSIPDGLRGSAKAPSNADGEDLAILSACLASGKTILYRSQATIL